MVVEAILQRETCCGCSFGGEDEDGDLPSVVGEGPWLGNSVSKLVGGSVCVCVKTH